ncbi:MAG: hypothetical protein HND48_23340 [Chloroflexi bacterium]|jgi:hypothetical protein|nr:hypothetical protein [Chloroflexota bacterium]OQY82915.1 MAG: hypothetical protein B6D42_08560 [Anaerolineae bacterium UTCFX5]GIK30143.1 MAG: hypothetical protein BroJett007_32810 [Chloroflexota bacterium]
MADDNKEQVLAEFDAIIADLQNLVAPSAGRGEDRYSRDLEARQVGSDSETSFYDIRTRALNLLHGIDSADVRLRNAIDYIRDIEPLDFNLQSALRQLRQLRSDYDADVLQKHPRLEETPPEPKVERRPWLNEPRAIIIAALIGGAFLLFGVWVGSQLNCAANSAATATVDSFIMSTREMIPTATSGTELTLTATP